MNRSEIKDAYEKAEHLAGGIANCAADEVCDNVAVDLGIPSAEVRRVMLDVWSLNGGG